MRDDDFKIINDTRIPEEELKKLIPYIIERSEIKLADLGLAKSINKLN
jgi:hypothetical protein